MIYRPKLRPKRHHCSASSKPAARPSASVGANLVMSIILFMILLVFAGMVTYTGMGGLISEEAQNVVSTSALVAASALYENTSTGGTPVLSEAQAQQAARDIFAAHVSLTPSLGSSATTIQGVTVNAGANTVTVQANSLINLPFLKLIGLDGIKFNHGFTAQATKYVPPGLPVTLGAQAPAGACGGAQPARQVIELDYPLTDRPGADLAVSVDNLRGYFILACSSEQCWDLGGAAKPLPGGATRTATVPGSGLTARAVYGAAYFDLASTSADYQKNVRKAASIVLMDDGVPDQIVNGQRLLELCPTAGITINRLEIYHQAVACVTGSTFCTPLANMQPMP